MDKIPVNQKLTLYHYSYGNTRFLENASARGRGISNNLDFSMNISYFFAREFYSLFSRRSITVKSGGYNASRISYGFRKLPVTVSLTNGACSNSQSAVLQV